MLMFTLTLTVLGLFWVLIALALGVGLRRLPRGSADDSPRVTVLVAARNEELVIGGCLEALARQDYPSDLWELLVIDDNSTDRTTAVVQAFSGRIPSLKLLPAGSPPSGIAPKKHALSKGISAASGEVILCTDADCTPPPGWIRGIAGCFEPEVVAVAGFAPLKGTGLTGAVGRFDAFVNAVISAGSIGLGKASTVAGRNFAYRREAWLAAGGFGESARGASGDDDLLLQRLTATSKPIVFCADSATFVPSPAPTSLAAWMRMKRRHWSAGRWYAPVLVTTAVALWLFQAGLLAAAGLSAAGVIPLWTATCLWLAKAAADGWTLARGAKLLNQRGWVGSWLAAEALTPLLFVLIMPLSLLGKIPWKGRELEN